MLRMVKYKESILRSRSLIKHEYDLQKQKQKQKKSIKIPMIRVRESNRSLVFN